MLLVRFDELSARESHRISAAPGALQAGLVSMGVRHLQKKNAAAEQWAELETWHGCWEGGRNLNFDLRKVYTLAKIRRRLTLCR